MGKKVYTSESEKDEALYFVAYEVYRSGMNESDNEIDAIFSGVALGASVAVSVVLSAIAISNGEYSYAPIITLSSGAGSFFMFIKSLFGKFKHKKLKQQFIQEYKEIESTPVVEQMSFDECKNFPETVGDVDYDENEVQNARI